MALSLGRALFTFASVFRVTNDTYKIPKIEFSVRVHPLNVVITPDPGKMPQDSASWAEFHNGVAAGLRISPTSTTISSSWITFNKPSELSPEHAGFLYGLGLTGHLKSMLTWHTFTYLTPKHDLTSIGVLLGLSTANVGTGNKHVRKLLAVHTPALLPKSSMELNIPLLTQAAGIMGVGILYLGTGNRRMAEVALGVLGRKDLSHSTQSGTDNREAYCVSAALAFGMIMLGRGSNASNLADLNFIERLRTFIHGSNQQTGQPAFDVNITSPAATVALALMFLRTNRSDVADSLAIPDTVTALNRIPPHLLMYRSLAKALIMWDSIDTSLPWIMAQFPQPIAHAMEQRVHGGWVDSAFELAYYYMVSGISLALGLRYAGTAKEEAYMTLSYFYDLFSKISSIAGMCIYNKATVTMTDLTLKVVDMIIGSRRLP